MDLEAVCIQLKLKGLSVDYADYAELLGVVMRIGLSESAQLQLVRARVGLR